MAQTPTEPARSDADDWHLLLHAGPGFAGIDTLFHRHKDYVFRLAWGVLGSPELAEDVTQEVFLRMAQGRRRWRPRARFRTWLYRVTLNTARELRRRRRELSLDAVETRRERTVPPVDPRLVDLERALACLSERQREAVVLRYFEGMSTRETARVMGCRQGTLKSHLHRAMAMLRETMLREGEVDPPPTIPNRGES